MFSYTNTHVHTQLPPGGHGEAGHLVAPPVKEAIESEEGHVKMAILVLDQTLKLASATQI